MKNSLSSTMRVLLSSAGRRVELINCFRQAGKDLGISVEILAADMDPEWSPACQVADCFFGVPRCTDSGFFQRIMSICRENEVNVVVPTIDTELLGYAKRKSIFKEAGVDVVVGSESFVGLARHKWLTMQELPKHGISVPMTWKNIGEVPSSAYPLIAKPVDGSCSQGIHKVRSLLELEATSSISEKYLFQEICQGPEYTVNCYYENGECRCAIPHRRVKTRSGEVMFAETERVAVLEDVAKRMAGIPGIDGPICFQAFYDPTTTQYWVFEINARFGGGYPICDYAGGRFALWLLQKRLTGTSKANNHWTAGVRMLRYDAAVFYP